MALTDPFAAYNAANNVEAQMLQNLLLSRGIEAHVTEDNLSMAIASLGGMAGVHRPQVWIDRSESERAIPVIDEFEKKLGLRRDESENVIDVAVEMSCDSCGKQVTFPADQRGTVQECPHCAAYLDVGGADGEWEDVGEEEEEEKE